MARILIVVESEGVDGVHFPKERFSKAMSFGPRSLVKNNFQVAKHPKENTPERAHRDVAAVTFPRCPADVPREVKAAVTRLRLNLGRPTEKEMLRLLAWQGAISKRMIGSEAPGMC